MNSQEILKLLEGLIVVTGVGSLIYVFFTDTTSKVTIRSQRDLIETLSNQVKELRTLHMDNEKAIAELKGKVSVYKELPLSELANSMKKLADAQSEIMNILKKTK